jgi:transposase-like protein
MSTKNGHHRQYEESFKQAAVELLSKNGGSVEASAGELGVDPADLRAWKRKLEARDKPGKTLRGMAQLRAENEALRSEIVSLQGQWDILKSTLGLLSTTVCSGEMI